MTAKCAHVALMSALSSLNTSAKTQIHISFNASLHHVQAQLGHSRGHHPRRSFTSPRAPGPGSAVSSTPGSLSCFFSNRQNLHNGWLRSMSAHEWATCRSSCRPLKIWRNVKAMLRSIVVSYIRTTPRQRARFLWAMSFRRNCCGKEREVAIAVSNRDVYYRISKKVGTSLFVMDFYFSTITINLMAATLMLIFSPSIVGGRFWRGDPEHSWISGPEAKTNSIGDFFAEWQWIVWCPETAPYHSKSSARWGIKFNLHFRYQSSRQRHGHAFNGYYTWVKP